MWPDFAVLHIQLFSKIKIKPASVSTLQTLTFPWVLEGHQYLFFHSYFIHIDQSRREARSIYILSPPLLRVDMWICA